jgi:hypothetical protein
MKFHVTNKELEKIARAIYRYHDYYNFSEFVFLNSPNYYNCGYAKNYDVWHLRYDICIINGYRNYPKNTKDLPNNVIKMLKRAKSFLDKKQSLNNAFNSIKYINKIHNKFIVMLAKENKVF